MRKKRTLLKPYCRFSPKKKECPIKLTTFDAEFTDSSSSVSSIDCYDSDPAEMCPRQVWSKFVTIVQEYKSSLEKILTKFPNSFTVQQNLVGIKKLEEYYNSYSQCEKAAPLVTCYDLCLREFEKLVHEL